MSTERRIILLPEHKAMLDEAPGFGHNNTPNISQELVKLLTLRTLNDYGLGPPNTALKDAMYWITYAMRIAAERQRFAATMAIEQYYKSEAEKVKNAVNNIMAPITLV